MTIRKHWAGMFIGNPEKAPLSHPPTPKINKITTYKPSSTTLHKPETPRTPYRSDPGIANACGQRAIIA